MKRIISLVLAAALLGGMFFSILPVKASAAGAWLTESFESGRALDSWKCRKGSVQISTDHSKLGNSAMRWSYQSGGTLTATYPEFSNWSAKKSGHGIKFWVYNEKPADANMTVKIGTAENVRSSPAYKFTVHMDFTGWRAVWVRVNAAAATGNHSGELDTMQIEVPKSMGRGNLYFDVLEITDNVPHYVCADYQLPYLPMNVTGVQYQSYLRIPKSFPGEKITQEQKDAFRTITNRLQEYLIPENADVSGLPANDPRRIRYESMCELARAAVRTYDSEFNIHRRSDGTLTGPGLFASRENIGLSHKKFVDLERIWVGLAFDYKLNHNESSKTKLLDLFDYAHDQGWAEGSGCGAMRYDEIRAAGYAYAVFLMQNELKETGRWERELANLRWRSEFGSLFIFDDPDFYAETFMSCDDFRSTALLQLMYIICMDDTPTKAGYMKAYLDYLRNVMEPSNNGDSRIKNDYTFWHHQGPYMASYGQGAAIVLSQIKYMLHDTVFDLDPASTETLIRALENYWNSAYRNDLPVRLRGRMPQKNGTAMDVLPAYGFLAASGSKEMAEIFLNLWNVEEEQLKHTFPGHLPDLAWMETPGQMHFLTDLAQQSRGNGYQSAGEPVGTYVYPFGGYMVHRQNGWALMCSGWSKYVWDYEGTPQENAYGRYANYGSAMVVPAEGFIAGGVDVAQGWDWNRWPGTTTIHLPNSALMTGGQHRNLSDDPFLGGISSEGNNGIYAMSLHDTVFDSSFRAKKSWFCFGDEIVCLGSSISNSDSGHRTETTLFQNTMNQDTSMPFYLNGKEITQFPYSKSFGAGEQICLTDVYGNSYISFGKGQLQIERGVQKSNLEDGKPSSGNVTTAYLSHGSAPRDGSYEYVILPAAAHEAAQQLARNKDYQVLQQDERAHIVRSDRIGGIGYVLFEANSKLGHGQLKSVNVPGIVMERSLNSNELLINFTDPDLRVSSGTPDAQKEPGRTQKATVTVRGKWLMETENMPGVSLSYKGQDTVLTFTCKAGEQFAVKLCKERKPAHSFTAQNAAEQYLAKAATCQEPASYYTSCADCGLSSKGTEFEQTFVHGEVNPENHTHIVVIPGRHATCTEDGLTEGKRCDACGVVVKEQQVIPAQPHDFSAEIADSRYFASEATCQTPAAYYTSCADCGLSSKGTEFEQTFAHGEVNPENHTHIVVIPGRDATCTEEGLTEGKRCDACGVVVEEQQVLPMKEHRFTAETVSEELLASAATCQAPATYYTSCADCGQSSQGTEFEAVFAFGDVDPENHTNIVILPGKNPTAEEDGLTEGKRCDDCGTVIEEQQVIPARPHDFSAQIADSRYLASEATCQTPAAYYTSCADCGQSSQGTEFEATFVSGEVDPENHVHTAVIPGRDATCTEEGLTDGLRCEDCGVVIEEQQVIPVQPHDFSAQTADSRYLASEATCQMAATYYTSCAVCGRSSQGTEDEAVFEHGEVNPENHTHIVTVPGRDATCTEEGLTAGRACEDCGVVIEEQQIIPVRPHDFSAKIAENQYLASEATCHTAATYYHSCTMCGKSAQGTEQEAVFEHGGFDPENHTHIVAVPGRDATCTETGLTAGSRCEDCGAAVEEQKVIPMQPHEFGAQVANGRYLASEATCQTAATYYESCAVCGRSSQGTASEAVFEHGEVNPENHTHIVTVPGKNATCTEEGLTAGKRCEDCGVVTEEQQVIPMKEHRFTKKLAKEQYLKTAASCESDAVYYLACADCGASAGETDPELTWTKSGTKLQHRFETYVPNQDATCTANGTETAHCAHGCGATDTREIPDSKLAHVDKNNDHKCDLCGQKMTDPEHCDCICHSTNFFDRLKYKSELLFWKMFGTNQICKCGQAHY